MFCWASLRNRSTKLTQAVVTNPRICIRARTLINKSEHSTSPSVSSSRSSYNEHRRSSSGLFLRSVCSGAVIFSSTLGIAYWELSSDSDSSSFVCFADDISTNDTAWVSDKKPHWGYLFGDGYRKRVFFNYEKRIRLQSPPEKVFEYFASFRSPDGEVLMTPADLMRAVVPVFPPSESDRVREGFLRGERVPSELQCPPSKFFMLFDTDNDGLISFPEYIFFVTLLSIPESSFSVAFKMFDLDNNGKIDMEEFKKVMGLMRTQNRQGARHRDGRRGGLKVAEPVDNGGLLEYFFGKDGKNYLLHERFVQFLRDLHNEMLKLEFAHYDHKSCGSIPAKDFASSLVASADISEVNKLLNRVDELSDDVHLRDVRITFEEFKAFAELRKQLQHLSMAIFSYGKVNGELTKKDFQRAASQVCGVYITDDLIDIIFHVFDANRDGTLSSNEFIRVLQRRENDNSATREAGLKGLLSCFMGCAKNCSSAKLLL